MLKRAQLLAFIMVLSVFATGAPTFGADCLKAKFPDSVKAGDADLQLNGLGIRKATIMAVKVYVAGLYVPQKSSDAGAILSSNLPWQLTLRLLMHPTSAMPSRKDSRPPPARRWPLFAHA